MIQVTCSYCQRAEGANLNSPFSIITVGWFEVRLTSEDANVSHMELMFMAAERKMKHPVVFCSKKCLALWALYEESVNA